ncbi:MAG: hypothetical protein ACRCWR_13405, partial [Saezia sp.]
WIMVVLLSCFLVQPVVFAQNVEADRPITVDEATEIAIKIVLGQGFTQESIGMLSATFFNGSWVVLIGHKPAFVDNFEVFPAHSTILISGDGKYVRYYRGV